MLDAAMQDCGWALRYARTFTCKTCAKLGIVRGLKGGLYRAARDFYGVFGCPAGQGEAESASQARPTSIAKLMHQKQAWPLQKAARCTVPDGAGLPLGCSGRYFFSSFLRPYLLV
jgi:hypothetical protein